jgi:hypothetical protein
MSPRVQHLLSALKQFQRMKPANRKKFLKSCNKDFIHCICECVRNLLKSNVPLSSAHLKKLSRHKQSLRKLALKATTLAARKKILQKGGFIELLISPLISGISSLIGSFINK